MAPGAVRVQLFGTDWTSAATLGHSRFRVAFWAYHGPPELRGKCLGACCGERRGLSCGSRSFGESVEGRVTGSVAVQGLGFRELPEEPGGRGL